MAIFKSPFLSRAVPAGGDEQRHSRDPTVHGLRVRGLKQRARRSASHLQTGQRLRLPTQPRQSVSDTLLTDRTEETLYSLRLLGCTAAVRQERQSLTD